MQKLFFIIVSFLVSNLIAQSPVTLQAELEAIKTEYNLPSLTAAVITNQSTQYAYTGNLSINNDAAISSDSKFHLGSSGKSVTAFIAAKLQEQGKLNFDDKLVDVIPRLKRQVHPGYLNITLGDLLSHRAGIQPFTDWDDPHFCKMPKVWELLGNQRLAFSKYALKLPPVKLAAGEHEYSNGGFVIAALMLEKYTGTSWENLVEKHLEAIGIEASIGYIFEKDTAQPCGHARANDGTIEIIPANGDFTIWDFFAPAGGLNMTVVDFAKYAQLHMEGLAGKDNYLSAASYDFLHRSLDDYSMGWYLLPVRNTNEVISYHEGSAGAFLSLVAIQPELGLSVVILTNVDDETGKTTEGLRKLRNALFARGKAVLEYDAMMRAETLGAAEQIGK